ncbi:MAG TPA: hypothetical protein PK096_01175 [Candidatus Saccharibacteria bacterium]|nr:hypothetical protein [Candidatus Saccharibacteria bacterium]HRK93960.1 hypothetical protein [Candidatus Saccharibacteria bacterium]
MANVLKKALTLLIGNTDDLAYLKLPKLSDRPAKKLTKRELIQMESEIGREIFGPIPKGHHREFFKLDKTTWIWYEEYKDQAGKLQTMTTRYEIQDNGILKAQNGARYSYIEGEELANLGKAVQLYYERVMRSVYNRDPGTGLPLA